MSPVRSLARVGRVVGRVVPVLALAAVLGGCGSLDGGAADVPDQDPGPRLSDQLIDVSALPEGWRDSNTQGIDFRLTVCGVDLEPEPPVRAVSIRFSRGPVGPFLEQHVRGYDDDSDLPAQVVGRLRDALPGCTGYSATGTSAQSETARFEVEPLTVDGAPTQSVAWRQTSVGDLPITSDIILVARGSTTVALMAYAIRDTPDPAVLAQAVAALPEGP